MISETLSQHFKKWKARDLAQHKALASISKSTFHPQTQPPTVCLPSFSVILFFSTLSGKLIKSTDVLCLRCTDIHCSDCAFCSLENGSVQPNSNDTPHRGVCLRASVVEADGEQPWDVCFAFKGLVTVRQSRDLTHSYQRTRMFYFDSCQEVTFLFYAVIYLISGQKFSCFGLKTIEVSFHTSKYWESLKQDLKNAILKNVTFV